MASHKSAKKRIRTNARKRVVNKNYESMLKTNYKKALASENKEEAEKLYKEAVSAIDRGATRGIIHLNNAARKKAALTKHLNSLAAEKK
ncbi:MAG TPA: 30S ribosomal protein S20 [Ignavibacteriaceae bacterium]|nr:30S ribosomal protein S20 [Ignavibacteriaceae bacterium]